MDLKRIKKYDQIDKKNFNDKVKDRGDLKTVTKNDKVKKDIIPINRVYADGDSRKVSSYQRPEKTKQNGLTKLPINEYKMKQFKMIPEAEKEQLCNRPAYLKRVRERYTTRLKTQTLNVPANPVKKEEPKIVTVKAEHAPPKENVKNVSVDDHVKMYMEAVTQTKDKEKESPSSAGTKEKKDQNTQRKKPIIKTIMTKNETPRVYKTVTFGEQRQKPTPLQIKIPNDSVQKNGSKVTDISTLKSKLTVSRVSVHEKFDEVGKKKKKRDKKFRQVPSQDGSCGGTSSPSTEVARWAPSSIDKHTKPYYEAWVNTTLAAISKCKNRERVLNDDKFMESLRKAFDRPVSQELIYSDFVDERYTGRIKITQG